MAYSIRISNYPNRITLHYLAHIMSMTNLMVIDVKRPKKYSEKSLEKEFIKLILMNPLKVLNLIVNQINAYHG